MRFRNYCIVALGNVDGIKDIINKMSETTPRNMQQKGVFIGTFSCTFTPVELRDIFDSNNRTFFIFEVGAESNAYKVGRDDIHEQLFGYIENGGEEVLNFMTSNLMGELEGGMKTSGATTNSPQPEKLTLEQQLEIAVQDEDYKLAAELRDVIKLNKKEE